MKATAWIFFIMAVSLHWHKSWLEVRDWSKRPSLYMTVRPTIILIASAWTTMAGSLLLIAIAYSVLLALLVGLATGLVLHYLRRFYFQREVKFWMSYSFDLIETFEKAGIRLSERSKRELAREYATDLVRKVRNSPIGLGTSPGLDDFPQP